MSVIVVFLRPLGLRLLEPDASGGEFDGGGGRSGNADKRYHRHRTAPDNAALCVPGFAEWCPAAERQLSGVGHDTRAVPFSG